MEMLVFSKKNFQQSTSKLKFGLITLYFRFPDAVGNLNRSLKLSKLQSFYESTCKQLFMQRLTYSTLLFFEGFHVSSVFHSFENWTVKKTNKFFTHRYYFCRRRVAYFCFPVLQVVLGSARRLLAFSWWPEQHCCWFVSPEPRVC